MANQDIRCAAAANGVRLWQIAEACGMTDSSLSRLLRRELPPARKQEIFAVIGKIASQGDDYDAENEND